MTDTDPGLPLRPVTFEGQDAAAPEGQLGAPSANDSEVNGVPVHEGDAPLTLHVSPDALSTKALADLVVQAAQEREAAE